MIPAVWISRPRRRAKLLAAELKKRGIRPVVKPAMRLLAVKNSKPLKQFAAHPHNFDMAIFTAEESVLRLQKLLSEKNNLPAIPALAIGPATLKAVAKIKIFAAEDAPAGDSAALLRAPQLRAENVRGKKIAVLGGITDAVEDSLSPQLCAALQKRGAAVFPIAAYRRMPPSDAQIANMGELSQLAKNKTLRAAVAYSGETAAAMLRFTAPDNAFLKKLPLFVIHANIAAAAKKAGYQNVILASAPATEMAQYIDNYLRGK